MKIEIDCNLIGGWIVDTDLCDRMVEDFESRSLYHVIGHSSRGYTYLTSKQMNSDLMTEYEDKIRDVLNHYTQHVVYSKETIAAFQLDPTYNIQRYSPGNHYSVWHCENNGEKPYSNRHLAFMTYLNTVDEGGETEFLYQNCKIKPKKGLTLIWPAYFTHTHRGLPAKTETKYVTTGWFTFFDTKNFLDECYAMGNEDFYASLDNLNRKVA